MVLTGPVPDRRRPVKHRVRAFTEWNRALRDDTRARVRSETWQRARSRRSVPTTSAACCDRRRCSTRGPGTGPAISTTQGCGRPRTTAIRDAVALQREAGVRTATDGEFRRTSWHMDFIYQLEGVDPTDQKLAVHFHNKAGDLDFETAALSVHDRVGSGTRSSGTRSSTCRE